MACPRQSVADRVTAYAYEQRRYIDGRFQKVSDVPIAPHALGFAGGLCRSEIVGLDLGRDQTEDGRGWIEISDKGLLLTLRGKTGWREVEIGLGSSDTTCPVVAVETWIKFAKLAKGPLFRRVTGKGTDVGPDRLNDRQVARIVNQAAMAAGVRGDLSELERARKFSGHSLRAGLASSAEVDERYV